LCINNLQVTGGPTILETAIPSVQKIATQFLRNLKVDLRLNIKVANAIKTADDHQILEFSDGENLLTDLYISTIGIKPNSLYIAEKYLNNNGFVIVDDFLKVKGVDKVWAIGDVSDREPPTFMCASNQAAYAAKALGLSLGNKTPLPYKDGVRGM
jgi:NADH dehydrogenase FAD-containing subunit